MILDIDENTDVADTNDTNNTNNKDFILMKEEYVSLLDDICSIKSVLYYKEKKAKRLLENIQCICNHNWVMDKPEYGSKTTYTCSVCDKSSL